MRMRWPSWMPGGMSTGASLLDDAARAVARLARVLDDPAGAAQRPQGWARTNWPKTVFETCWTGRRPAGRAGTGLVPGSAPVPSHVAHGTATRTGRPRDAAGRLDELDRDLGGDVGARAAPAPAADAEEVVAEERGEEVAERAEVEARRA
jgi:hypothetical protein